MSPAPRRQMSLRSSLVLLIAGSLVPFLFVGGLLVQRLVRDSRDTIERTLLDSARQQATALDAEMDASIRALQTLAVGRALVAGDLAAFETQAREAVRTQPGWMAIRLLAPDGRVLVNTAIDAGEDSGAAVDPASVAAAVHTRAPAVAALRRGPKGRLAFGVRVPVRDGETTRYVLTAVIPAETIGQLIARVSPVPNEWTRVVVDAAGTVVARTRSPERFVGSPATGSFRDRTRDADAAFYRDTSLEGEAVYVAFSHSAFSQWVSAVVVPVSVMDGPLRQSLIILVGVGLLVLLVSTGGAYWLAGRIASDITGAARSADALARGEPVVATASIASEVTRLGQSLEAAAGLLRSRSEERDRNLAQAEAARADAEQASLAKDQFLAMLGHELRNPLAPIGTALALLKLKGRTWTHEHAVIERQVAHMSRLVDDLLDVSRITRGTLEIRREDVAVADVVTRAAEMASPLLEERRHSLRMDVPAGLWVRGDAVRLAQVFGNLLTNAARYTPDGGTITVQAHPEGTEVAVDVVDTGRGIPPELAPHLFDVFVQGPRTIDRREGGLGLGLAIARSLITLHGGRIVARSAGVGLGSTFTVHLPAASPAPTREAAQPRAEAADRSPTRVLVVDDNRDAAEMLATLLRLHGHDVVTASDGPEALSLLDTFAAGAAILDIGLPVMDGYELARRIREKRPHDTPMLVAVTGYGQGGDRERSSAAGFTHHLVKPVDHEELLRLLQPQPA